MLPLMPSLLASSVMMMMGLANSEAFSKSIKTTMVGRKDVENLGLVAFSYKMIWASLVPLFY